MQELIFPDGSVPVNVVAKIYGKDPSWVRAGLIVGWLPIGFATCNGKRVTSLSQQYYSRKRTNYYISPKLLYEATGYLWDGKSHG